MVKTGAGDEERSAEPLTSAVLDARANGAITPRRRRKRWPWVVGGVTILAALGLLGLSSAVNQLDNYSADFTKGCGDFSPHQATGIAETCASDGLHLRLTESRIWAPWGVEAPSAHAALGVEVAYSPIGPSRQAAIGPFCWQDPDHGYGLVKLNSGQVALVEEQDGRVSTLLAKPGRVLPAGREVRLMLSCALTHVVGSSAVSLVGFEDGARVISDVSHMKSSGFSYTGFSGFNAGTTTAEWRITKFWRLGPSPTPQ